MNTSIVKRIIGAISLAAYASLMSIYNADAIKFIPITAIVALVCGWIVAPRVIDYISFLKEKRGYITFSILLILFSTYSAYAYLNALGVSFISFPYGLLGILMIPAIAMLYLAAGRFFIELLSELFETSSDSGKTKSGGAGSKNSNYAVREYIFISIALSVLTLWCYLRASAWFCEFDLIYSTDSSAVLNDFYLSPGIYDIRHPVISNIMYPIGVFAMLLRLHFVPTMLQGIDLAYIIALFHIQLILLTGKMISRIAGDEKIFRLYAVSFAPMLMCVAFDKYAIMVFLLVAYVYYKDHGASRRSAVLLCAAAGAWITSAAMGVEELFVARYGKDGACNKGKDRADNEQSKTESSNGGRTGSNGSIRVVTQIAKRIGLIILGSFAMLICTGRLCILLDPSDFLTYTGLSGKASLGQGIRSFINMITGCLVPLDTVWNGWITWENLTTTIPAVAIVIGILIIFGVVDGRRDRATRYFLIWLAIGAFLFVICRWNVIESPLFSYYFVWAVVPLFVKGLRFICKLAGWNDDVAVDVTTLIFALMNVTQIVVITGYIMAR